MGTYYGGVGGYINGDAGFSVATDHSGNVYLAGKTLMPSGIASGGFQDTIGGGTDAFLVKFNSAGVRQWGTYYGGSGDDVGSSVATDTADNVYLGGTTTSTNLPLPIKRKEAGPFWAGTVVNDASIGTVAWSNPSNAQGGNDDNLYAVTGILTPPGTAPGAISNYLKATNFGAIIPSGGIVTGIKVGIEDKALGIVGIDYKVNLVVDNIIQSNADNKAKADTIGIFESLKIYGDSVDTWSLHLKKADVENPGFGVAISVTKSVAGSDVPETISVDRMSITVYYTLDTNAFQPTIGGGGRDAFLVKFDSAGNRLWSTYYGGEGQDYGYGVAVDTSGNVYMSGETGSKSFGIASTSAYQNKLGGGSDAFIVKFNDRGNRLWGTYYGGKKNESNIMNDLGTAGSSVATDEKGNVYLAGYTGSDSGIATTGAYQSTGVYDDFLVKFSSIGERLWATYYGGQAAYEEITINSVATDASGNVYLTGGTYSPGSSLASDGFQNSLIGTENTFLVNFDSSGNRICATYFGKKHNEGSAVAVDKAGNIYLAGSTQDTSGIATAGAHQRSYGGGAYDAFLRKFAPYAKLPIANFSSKRAIPTSAGECINFTDRSTNNPTSWNWNFPGATPATSTEKNPTNICYQTPGTYFVTLTNTNGAGTNTTTKPGFIIVNPAPTADAGSDQRICFGDVAHLLAGGGTTYSWSPIVGLNNSTIANPDASPAQTTKYIVTVGNDAGCFAKDTVIVVVDSAYLATLKKSVNYGTLTCDDSLRDSVVAVRNTGTTTIIVTPNLEGNDPSQFSFSSATATIPVGGTASFTVRFQPGGNGLYSARIRFTSDPCGKSDTTHLAGTKNSNAAISITPLAKLLFDTLVCDLPAYRDSIVRIKNTGTLTVTLNPATVSGTGFTLVSPTTSITLAPGTDTVYKIRFAPTQGARTYNGSFSVSGSPCNVAQTISLVGAKDSVKIVSSVKTLNFDTLKCGDSVKTLTVNVKNEGTKTLTVSSNNPGNSFTVSPASQIIGGNNSGTFTVTFKPSAVGSYSGVVQFTGSLCSAIDSVKLVGMKKENLKLSSTPDTLDFMQVICDEAESTVLVNKGTDTVYLDPASVSGNGFTLVSPTGAIKLAPGDSIRYTIKFSPNNTGTYTGKLLVTASPCAIVIEHALRGKKESAVIAGMPSEVNFGSAIPCAQDIDTIVQIVNYGTVTDTITSATFTSNAFELVSPTLPFTLAPNASQDVRIRFHTNKLTDSVLAADIRFMGKPCDIMAGIELEGKKNSPVVSLSISSSTVTVGHHILLPIILSQPFNGAVKDYRIDVSYDSTMLIPHYVSTLSTMSEGATTTMNVVRPGLVNISASRSTPFTGKGTLINLDVEGTISKTLNGVLHIENVSFDTKPCNTITTTDGEVNLLGCETDRSFRDGTTLGQNKPNPFSQSTVVSYQLSVDQRVELAVYDVFGRKVKTLDEGVKTKGEHSVTVEMNDMPQGIYIYQLRLANKILSKKMVVVK